MIYIEIGFFLSSKFAAGYLKCERDLATKDALVIRFNFKLLSSKL